MEQLKFNVKKTITHIESNIKIYKTYDLDRFILISGNRIISEYHINRLAYNIKQFGMLCNPILVNEKMQVIDGQHRLISAIKNKTFIYYIIVKGYDLKEVKALNMQQKNWSTDDFLYSYANMGILDYKLLLKFKEKHDIFSIGACLKLCTQSSRQSIAASHTKQAKPSLFRDGKFKIGNMVLADQYAADIKKIGKYFEGYSSTSFVSVMVFLFKRDNFNFDQFMQKLKMQPISLVKCASSSQYKELIEKIYNYRRRNKVNLRF